MNAIRRSTMQFLVVMFAMSLSGSLFETITGANASFAHAPSTLNLRSRSLLALVPPRSSFRRQIAPRSQRIIQSRTALQIKLRDYMGDGKKKNDPDSFDVSNLDRRTKLSHQLLTKSTPEIKRELEYTYGISTVGLMGRDKLISALVDARLKGSSQSVSGVAGSPEVKSPPPQRTTATSPNSKDFRQINTNHGPDIEKMGVGDIKRELKLYGVNVDAFVEKRELMEALKRERELRAPTSARPKNTKVVVVPGVGNVASGDSRRVAATNSGSQSTNDSEKQREFRIAYEFEHIQTSLADPLEILTELESQYSISTKYFSGAKEMAYALAVARVDASIEKEKRGQGQGSVIGENLGNDEPISRNRNSNMKYSSNFVSPTSEELVAMEYENLQSWDQSDLAAELENQYGIQAKHFLGKKEMAYALAVERIEQAANEGGFIVDDDDDDYYYKQDEDEEEDEVAFDSYFQSAQEGWNTATDGNYGNNYDMFRMLEEEMRKEEEQKRLRQMAASDPRSTDEFISAQNKKTPLADMANGKKSSRQYSHNRTPLSSEQPSPQRQRQRRQNVGRGTVMGGRTNTPDNESKPLSAVAREADEKLKKARTKRSTPLSDILKGAEEKQQMRSRRVSTPLSDILKGQQTERRRSANDPYRTRNKPPPRPKATSTGRFDDSFSVGDPFNSYNRASSRRTGSQMPFEPTPFTAPGSRNAAQSTSSRPPRKTTFSRSQKPYEPTFTPPRKHDTTNMPPPPKSSRQNSRKFNFKDGPDFTQPFVGSQVWVNENVPPSPPLQVEPPPRDPNYKTPERPFEPTPFSTFQPHSVRDDRPPTTRDRFRAPPPPPSPTTNRNQSPPSSGKKQTYKSNRDVSSPFDKFKDAFNDMSSRKKPREDRNIYNDPEGQEKGFTSGNVEVLTGDGDTANKWQSKKSGTVIIDAIIDDEKETPSSESYKKRNFFFTNAWKGGPQSEAAEPATANDTNNFTEDTDWTKTIRRAQQLLADDPKLRYMATIAQSNPRVKEAVDACMDNPSAFGQYLADPEIGPILEAMRKSI